MNDSRREHRSTARARAILAGLRALVMTVATVCAVGSSAIRVGETNDAGTAIERIDEVSLLARATSLCRTSLHGRREAIVFTSSIQARLGRDQQSQFTATDGHRLPNGLLAPMTC